jgi:two-component system phosphate regulon response regulator PhoB
MTALEFRLLVTLATRRGRVMTREALLDDVWGIQAEVETRTVDTMMKRLRDKLSAAGRYVETVRGVGYRFSDRDEPA